MIEQRTGQETEREPYEAPKVVVAGRLSELTAGHPSGAHTDSHIGGPLMS